MTTPIENHQRITAFPDKPLEVKLIPADKKDDPKTVRRRLFLELCLGYAILILGGWGAIYLTPAVSTVLYRANQPEPDLWLALTFPQYLAIGDERTIEATTTNLSQQPITATITLSFGTGNESNLLTMPIHLAEGSSNVFDLGNMRPGQRATKLVKFQIGLPPQQALQIFPGTVTVSPQISTSNESPISYTIPSIKNWPLLSQVGLLPKQLFTGTMTVSHQIITPVQSPMSNTIQPMWISPFPYSQLLLTAAFTAIAGFALSLVRDFFKKQITGSDSDK
jgi:hypothetical protein